MASSRDSLLLAEAFKALGKAVKRKAYESDSDDYIEQPTNRGSKLKKRARFVRRGQLGPTNSPHLYKETVEHASYQRTVISRNPPLIDEDGYEIDSEDDEERVLEAQAEADEINPYASVRLEEILAPLTSSADLANHATLSRPFRSTALTELSNQGLNLMHKESEALWKVRPLLTRLCGDHTWASCDMMLGPNDEELFPTLNGAAAQHRRVQPRNRAPTGEAQKPVSPPPRANGEQAPAVAKDQLVNGAGENGQSGTGEKNSKRQDSSSADIPMQDADPSEPSATEPPATTDTQTVNGDKAEGVRAGNENKKGDCEKAVPENGDKHAPSSATNGEAPSASAGAEKERRPLKPGESDADASSTKTAAAEINGQQVEKKAVHEAGAADAPQQANGVRTASVLGDEEVIHPYFLAPPGAYPDRDAGLPQQDAEDVRRLLQLYVQKQEEVCRGTRELYEGLLRADRLRRTVLNWSKAEAHCGANRDMSDGEDWYDKEEWGLTEDLKKGQDEEEEDTTKDQPKKTRNRR